MRKLVLVIIFSMLGCSLMPIYSQSILDSDGSILFQLPFEKDSTFNLKTIEGEVFVYSSKAVTYFSSVDTLNILRSTTIHTKKQIFRTNYGNDGKITSIEILKLGFAQKRWLLEINGSGKLVEMNIYNKKRQETVLVK